jgi:hypothetical protein
LRPSEAAGMVLLVPDWGMGESAAETAAVSNYHARISEQSTHGDPSGWKDPEFQPEPLEDELALLPLKSQVRYYIKFAYSGIFVW